MRLLVYCGEFILHELRKSRIRPSDIILLLGDIYEPRDLLETLRSRNYRVLSVTGRLDDHHVAHMFSLANILVENKLINIEGNMYIAGIGGRDPFASLQAIKNSIRRINPGSSKIIVASYYCPYGLCDKSAIGGRRGLTELRRLLADNAIEAMVSCDCGPGSIYVGDKLLLCLGAGKHCHGEINFGKGDIAGKVVCSNKLGLN